MNLQRVTGPAFTAECIGCHEKKLFGDKPEKDMFGRPNEYEHQNGFADLDGEPFKAYYCDDCAAKMRTEGAPMKPISSSEKQAALDAANKFLVRANGLRVKQAALRIVADFEQGKTAAPGDPGDPNTPPNPDEVQRDQPAAQPQQPNPAQPTPPPQPKAQQPQPEAEPEEPVVDARAELETTLSNEETITAVIEFLKEEGLDLSDVKIDEGMWGWSQAADFAHVELGDKEFFVAPSEERAEQMAKAMVVQDLENEPELFTPSWLEGHIDTDNLRDQLMGDVEEMIRESPDSYGWEPGSDADGNELVRYNAEGEEDDDGEYDSAGNVIEEQTEPSDEWVESKAQEILRDPIEYLRDIYGNETMKRAIEIAGINIDEAADEAISADGYAHFLSTYDGHTHELPSGGVWWRHN
jgi:hypothetical protein